MKRRDRTWVGLIIGVIGTALLAFLGLFTYISFTSTPLHPDVAKVPSVQQADPMPQWAGAAEQARRIARASVIEQNLPGLSIAVGVGGDVVWAEGFGWADLDKRIPVGPRLRFRIGTASTALTSAGVGLLLEKQKLKLDDEIQTYVPEFPRKQWPVTVRQVMGHVAGIGNDSGDEGPLLSQHCQRPVDALPAFADDALLFEPATRYRFSRYDWILVSAAIEKASGEPFLRFMRQQVFEPLDMNDTKEDAASAPAGEAVTPYFPRFAADTRYGPDPMREVDYSCYAGSSAFVSTPSDLVRFVMAINRGTLLQPATVQLLQAPQRLLSGQDTGYGLGWDLETVALPGGSARVAGHDGDLLGGMVASFMTLPDGTVVAVTSNTSYADTAAIALHIGRIFSEQKKSPGPARTGS
ncbi:MAG: serine hydrolase domain-containing protein [Vicinamibacteraceae bacterium]